MSYYETINMVSQPRALCRMRGYPELTKKAEKLICELKHKIWKTDHKVTYNSNRLEISKKVTLEELKKARKLNEKRRKLMPIIRKEFKRLYDIGYQRVQDKEDWVIDFNIILNISYVLGKDDPAYDEEGDNFICEFNDDLGCQKNMTYDDLVEREVLSIIGDLDEKDIYKDITPDEYCHDLFTYTELWNHSEYQFSDWDLVNKDYHTYMFHDLNEHQNISFSEIARIKEIWLDITISYNDENKYISDNKESEE